MNKRAEKRVLKSRSEYREAVERAAELRGQGETAESNAELAAIEGAIALYVAKPGEPARCKGRPRESGKGM